MQKTRIQIFPTKVLEGMQFLAPSGRTYTAKDVSDSEVVFECNGDDFKRNKVALLADINAGKWVRVNQAVNTLQHA